MKKLLLLLLCLPFLATPNELGDIMEVLKYVETNNDTRAIGDKGDSFGSLQIQAACVEDVNRYYGTSYRHRDMFQEECAEEVFLLYAQMGADLYFRRHGKYPTEEVIVRNHNGGIYRGYRIKATVPYYEKYKKFKRLLIKTKKKC